jgi:hypothetical protein
MRRRWKPPRAIRDDDIGISLEHKQYGYDAQCGAVVGGAVPDVTAGKPPGILDPDIGISIAQEHYGFHAQHGHMVAGEASS